MARLEGAIALVTAAMLLAAVRVALLVVPYATVQRAAARASRPRAARPDRLPAALVAWRVARAARIVPGASCLVQALAARVLLARAGYASRLRIGVARRAQGALEAHAWVECDGVVVIGGVDDVARFVPLPDLPAAGPRLHEP